MSLPYNQRQASSYNDPSMYPYLRQYIDTIDQNITLNNTLATPYETTSRLMMAAYRDYSSFSYVPQYINNIYQWPDKIFALLISFNIISPSNHEVSLSKISISIHNLQWYIYVDIKEVHMYTRDIIHIYTGVPLTMASIEQRNFLFNNLQYLRGETSLSTSEIDYNEI